MSDLGDLARAEGIAAKASWDAIATSIEAMPSGGAVWPSASNLIGGALPSAPTLISGDTDSLAVNLTYYDRLCDGMPDGAVMFFGHSQMQALTVAEASPFGINLGYGGSSTRRLIHHMMRTAYRNAMARAGAGVILCPGCNDAGNTGYYGSYAGAVSTVVGMFSNQIKNWVTGKWVIVAPLPGDERVSGFPSGYNPAMVSIGSGLASALSGVSNVAFVDPWAELIDVSGNLATANHNGDGQHLSRAGNAILATAIKGALESLGTGA